MARPSGTRTNRVAAQRPASCQTGLIHSVNDDGWLYQACRPVSDTDINVAHFLSSGLILFKGHFNGSPPHNYNPTT